MSADAAPRTAAKKRKTRWAIAGVVAVIVIAAVVVLPMLRKPVSPTAGLNMEKVTRTTLVVAVSGDGSTRPVHTSDVYPQVSGTVKSVEVKLGDTVKKGDTLFTIDGADLNAQVLQAKAALRQSQQGKASALQQVAQAGVQKAQAAQQLDKLESMPATQTSDTDLAIAKKQVAAAGAAVSAANASLTSANASVANAQNSYSEASRKAKLTTVHAPADGVVTALSVATGGSVSTGGGASSAASSMGGATAVAVNAASSSAPIVISDISELKVRIAANEVDIPQLKVGQETSVTLDAVTGLVLDGKVSWISPNGMTTQGVVTYDVDITLASQDDRLRPDMTASAIITTDTKKDALVISSAAIKVNGSTRYVDLLAADGSTSRANITVGVTTDTRTEILSGLKEGATVVIGAIKAKTQGGFAPPGMGGN